MRYLSRFFSLSGFMLLFATLALFAMSDVMLAQADGGVTYLEPSQSMGALTGEPVVTANTNSDYSNSAATAGTESSVPWGWIALMAVMLGVGLTYTLRRPTTAYSSI